MSDHESSPPVQGAPGPDAVVVAAPSVLSSPLGGEVVLLEPGQGVYYSLNEVGARVWELIQDPVAVEEICREIAEEYEVDDRTCRRDVGRVLSELIERGLAEIDPSGG